MSKKGSLKTTSRKAKVEKVVGSKKTVKRSEKAVSGNRSSSAQPVGKREAAAPRKMRGKLKGIEREKGPRAWLYPILESTYTKLVPREETEAAESAAAAAARGSESRIRPTCSRLISGVEVRVLTTWRLRPMPNGLPDAPVFDIQIHPTRRLLRVSTHGRGMYEYQL